MVNLCIPYSELNRYIQKEEYEKVIACADSYLSACYDGKVFHCKVVALLNLNRFEECVETLGADEAFLFEKAYSLYRLGRMEEALSAVDSSPEKEKSEYRELKAQICYAMGNYEASYNLYRSILRQSTDKYDDERKTNLIASLANLQVSSDLDTDLVQLSRDKDVTESYESLFNIACLYMNARKFAEAEQYLRLAEKCCIEETPQEDVDNEVQVVKTQLACCKHFQRKHDLAYDAYKSVLDCKPNDSNITAVIHNNMMVMNKNTNYFELKKNLKTLQNDLLVSKLTPLQKSVINSNIRQICVMNSECIDEALSNCDVIFGDNNTNREMVLLLKAACYIKYNDINKALEFLKTNCKSCQVPKLKLCLAMAQIYLNTGDYVKACTTLRSLEEDVFRPGIFSALVTIMIARKDFNGIEELLRENVDFYRLNKRSLAELWHYLSGIKLNAGLKGVVLQSLQELLKIRPNDYKVLSKLTIAYSKISPSKAFSLCDRIRECLVFEVQPDAERLETTNWSLGITHKTQTKSLQSSGEIAQDFKRIRRSKKKRKRLPKNLDPMRPPDPERWLPKHERSTFKRRHDRRNRGDLPKAQQLDMTKQAKESKPSPPAVRTSDDPKANLKYLHKRKKRTGRR